MERMKALQRIKNRLIEMLIQAENDPLLTLSEEERATLDMKSMNRYLNIKKEKENLEAEITVVQRELSINRVDN